MTVEEALKLIGIDSSEIVRDESEEYSDFVLFGSYKDEQDRKSVCRERV